MSEKLIPWRGVSRVDVDETGTTVLHLACGHTETWPTGHSTPTATRCRVCDPPTFHGKPFPEKAEGDPA